MYMGNQYSNRIRAWLMLGVVFFLVSTKVCSDSSIDSTYGKAESSNLGTDFMRIISSPKILGCIPCSQKFLGSSLFEKSNSLLDSDFLDLCKSMSHKMSDVYKLTIPNRNLSGEGSHRRLISSIEVSFQSDFMSGLDAYFCEALIIERLPSGVFADPFELQHLVQRGVLLDAAVFGDVNLELPSALSNRSSVEVHMDIGHGILLRPQEGLDITIELPLHARYPPLDERGYVNVEISAPDLMVRCTPKVLQEECFSFLQNWSAAYADKVSWQIPCGNPALAGIVSVVTFSSALFSALLIAFSAVYCSYWSRSHND